MMGTTSSCATPAMTARLRSWLDSDLTFLRTTNVTSPSMKTEKRGIEFVTGSVIEASGSAGGKQALPDTVYDCIIFHRPSDFCSSACRQISGAERCLSVRGSGAQRWQANHRTGCGGFHRPGFRRSRAAYPCASEPGGRGLRFPSRGYLRRHRWGRAPGSINFAPYLNEFSHLAICDRH